jgi:aspartate/methionine/tyrosine aminotransferase
MQTPWSKQHKREFAGAQYSLSNSFAQPLTWNELQHHATATTSSGDSADSSQESSSSSCQAILDEYHNGISFEYTPNGGSFDLRTAIAELYNHETNNDSHSNHNKYYNQFSPRDHVLVTAGGQVAIQLAVQAIATAASKSSSSRITSDRRPRPRLHAIVFTPGYQSNIQSPTWVGAKVTKIPRRPEKQWQIDIADVQQAIQQIHDKEDAGSVTIFMILNEPHNPSGIVMSQTTQQQLVNLCRQYNIIIIADEVYRLLEHEGTQRIPAFCQVYEKAISIVTMSKPWGACGITIGWCICQDTTLVQHIWNAQYFGTACMSRAAELHALLILKLSSRILHDRLSILQYNKKQLQNVIETQYPDLLAWQRPNAGAICFVKFQGPLTSQQFGQILRKHNISIKPAYCFIGHMNDDDDDDDTNTTELQQYFRVGFGERKMLTALEAFVKVMETYKDEWRATMGQQQQQQQQGN